MNYRTTTSTELQAVTFLSLTSSPRKNGHKGEVVGRGRSGHPTACPVVAATRCLLHLRSNDAPGDTPLSSYFTGVPPRPTGLSPHVITSLLHQACLVLGNSAGITTRDISVKSLRASGAMALLNE